MRGGPGFGWALGVGAGKLVWSGHSCPLADHV
jgi:hypothetical protein